MSWDYSRTEDGRFQVTYNGEPFGNSRPSHQDVLAYLARLKERYPHGQAALVQSVNGSRTRGGPWRWRLPDGSTGVIHTQRKADAITVLRYNRQTRRLPRGIVWEIAAS